LSSQLDYSQSGALTRETSEERLESLRVSIYNKTVQNKHLKQ